VLNPCTGDPSSWPASCQWFDNATVLSMQKSRWYSTAEALADGSVVLIGGFVNGASARLAGGGLTDRRQAGTSTGTTRTRTATAAARPRTRSSTGRRAARRSTCRSYATRPA
jgi:hypothetical protein